MAMWARHDTQLRETPVDMAQTRSLPEIQLDPKMKRKIHKEVPFVKESI